MDEVFRELAELDDFQVIAERHRVMKMIATLTDRYRELNQEMTRRETLLADPEALGNDVLESCLYLLRERLRAS